MELKELITTLNSLNPFSILYVEDEESIRQSMTPILKRFSTDISVAENGQEGWEYYQQRPFSIVLTDLQMPILNGTEMIRRIRAISPQQIIIVITAFKPDDELNLSDFSSCQYYLSKPLILSEFISVLENIIPLLPLTVSEK